MTLIKTSKTKTKVSHESEKVTVYVCVYVCVLWGEGELPWQEWKQDKSCSKWVISTPYILILIYHRTNFLKNDNIPPKHHRRHMLLRSQWIVLKLYLNYTNFMSSILLPTLTLCMCSLPWKSLPFPWLIPFYLAGLLIFAIENSFKILPSSHLFSLVLLYFSSAW